MTAFTPAADARLHAYLTQVRQALCNHPDVSPDDVEADLREHIDTEFAHLNRPVMLSELDAVLAQLGPPTQWANAGANSQSSPRIEPFDWTVFLAGARRRVLGVFASLWKGPEDWRLAYLTFGLTLLAPFTLGFTLVVAYVFGRAAVELAKEKGQPLGARRWLTYPAIVVVALPLFLALSLSPAVIAFQVTADERMHATRMERAGWVDRNKKPVPDADRAATEQFLALVRSMPGSGDTQEVLFSGFVAIGALAAWWTILGMLMWALPKWATTIFHPLLDGYDGMHGVRLAACSGLALIIWIGFAYRLLESAKVG
jgi:hypothetical protein